MSRPTTTVSETLMSGPSASSSLEVTARPRLKQRLLITTLVVSPTPISDAYVINGLLSQLDPAEVVVAAERWPSNPIGQTHEPQGHYVHFIGHKWTWPKRGQRFVHWLKWITVPRTLFRLAKLARRHNCGALLANFPDERLLFAAYVVARLLRLKLFPFFHNTYRENRRGVAYLFASWLQQRVFQRAEAVFVMSEGMKQELEKLYRGVNFCPLVHTFDQQVPSFEPLPPLDRTRIRLGYMGSVSEANLDALKRICQMVNDSPDLALNFYSAAPDWFLEKQGLVGERIRPQQPADSELISALGNNDLLILPHGLTGGLAPIEYRTIFPTRTIPYLLSGRPIVAYSAQGSFLSKWLRQHDCADVVENPDPSMLRAAIDRLCDDAARREQLAQNALRAAECFRADRVVAEMKTTINHFLP